MVNKQGEFKPARSGMRRDATRRDARRNVAGGREGGGSRRRSAQACRRGAARAAWRGR